MILSLKLFVNSRRSDCCCWPKLLYKFVGATSAFGQYNSLSDATVSHLVIQPFSHSVTQSVIHKSSSRMALLILLPFGK